MKKRIILLASTFALLACSEDIYQEIDQQNDKTDIRTPSSFEDNNPGWINVGGIPYIIPGDGYQSPWEIYVTIPIGSHLWRTSGPLLVVGP